MAASQAALGPDEARQLLGVSKNATAEEVRQAYKRAALRWHPDKNPSNREEAAERFKLVFLAQKILSTADPKLGSPEPKRPRAPRSRHDRPWLEEWIGCRRRTQRGPTSTSAKAETRGSPADGSERSNSAVPTFATAAAFFRDVFGDDIAEQVRTATEGAKQHVLSATQGVQRVVVSTAQKARKVTKVPMDLLGDRIARHLDGRRNNAFSYGFDWMAEEYDHEQEATVKELREMEERIAAADALCRQREEEYGGLRMSLAFQQVQRAEELRKLLNRLEDESEVRKKLAELDELQPKLAESRHQRAVTARAREREIKFRFTGAAIFAVAVFASALAAFVQPAAVRRAARQDTEQAVDYHAPPTVRDSFEWADRLATQLAVQWTPQSTVVSVVAATLLAADYLFVAGAWRFAGRGLETLAFFTGFSADLDNR
jgi:curved DNA-binding protein CbpA